MKNLSSKQIKDKFLEFFEENKHTRISDSSIIPKNDPTLLFINSGMAPIKDYFTGAVKPPAKRLCNVQPCIRTIDIDSIGDKHHLTSFQMLGSWSIGDYFKKDAITFAYTLLTKYIGIPSEKLYVTVFSGDEEMKIDFDQEAYDCWKAVGVSDDHIVACGKDDNFWGPTSETGPCGPCTEIFFDTGDGEKYVKGGNFDTKKRYIEIWNAGVFMQFNKNADKTFSKLAFNSVDTGAGLERLAMVLGGYDSVYDTDLLSPIREKIISELKSQKISEKETLILTDHLRTASIILSEKVSPSNEGRGYTPRKLIRRCMMIISKNKVSNFNFSKIVKFILEKYKDIFPLFEKNYDFVVDEFEKEYKQFEKVLKNGLERLSEISGNEISSKDAFELVTTYGLPFDIINQYAIENNKTIDKLGYENEIKKHKEKSKNISENNKLEDIKRLFSIVDGQAPTNFVGYETLFCSSKVLKIIKESNVCESAKAGEKVWIVFDRSCFYAVSGGQCSDTGYIENEKFKAKIEDVRKTSENVFLHLCSIENGEISTFENVNLAVDSEKRYCIEKNHSAVHLLQSALRKVYGQVVHQAGSNVDDKKLRFDFNYENNITDADIIKIENIVNAYIMKNISRKVEIKNLQEAISEGAMALFESKYKDEVRVISFGDVSKELCGGTHTSMTGNIGLFKIISAEGIGKGVKRISAVTGFQALSYIQSKISDLNHIAKICKTKVDNVVEKLEGILSQNNTQKEKFEINPKNINNIYSNANGLKIDALSLCKFDKKIQSEAIKISNSMNNIFLVICGEDIKQVVVCVSDKLQNIYSAKEIIANLNQIFSGKGGGNKKVATAAIRASFDEIVESIKKICIN